VRGGKVIGRGFNDYRPGFNGGGILKTGKLAADASSSPAILALKQRRKSKSKHFSPDEFSLLLNGESMEHSDLGGGGYLANSPLSMHSEMMAIQSALSLSSNTASYGSARSSTLMQNPGLYKLPARGKRQLRLQNLKDYVDTVCGEIIAAKIQGAKRATSMQRGGEAQVQGSQFEASASQCCQGAESGLQQQGGEEQGERERAASHSEQYYVRPQEASKYASSSVPASPSGPQPPYPRHYTTTRKAAI
jgi:hypothetical protein